MRYAHLVQATVFSYEHENTQSILDAILGLFPFNLEDKKIFLEKHTATGFNEKKINIFQVRLVKNSLINEFLTNLLNNIDSSQKNILLQQAESRLDSHLDFFIRFDKDRWINERKLYLTDSGRCFHLRISIAAFPKKREIALKVIREMLELE